MKWFTLKRRIIIGAFMLALFVAGPCAGGGFCTSPTPCGSNYGGNP